jgi:transposase
VCKKVLDSLDNHWDGLTVFVDHPELPMDNNKAERQLRGPVLGRKNYNGSGSEWSGRFAAVLFSIFQTLNLFRHMEKNNYPREKTIVKRSF